MKQIIVSTFLLLFSFVAMADQYRVELSVFEQGVGVHYFNGMENVKVAIDINNLYRYYVGDFDDLATAKAMQKKAVANGHKYAKVVNYTEAKLACANSCTSPDRIKNIFFDYDQYTLRQQSKDDLDNLSLYLQTNTKHKVRVEGHTDDRGSEFYNNNLSRNRAVAAKRYLVDTGVADYRIIVREFGESSPIAYNDLQGSDSSVGRQFNRRVVFTILDELGGVIDGMVEPIEVPEFLRIPLFQETEAFLSFAF